MPDANTLLLLHFSGTDGSTTFTDSSASAHSFTANGNAQIDTAQYKFGTASLLSDGTGDDITSANHADWNLGAAGAGDFTIECQARWNALGTTYHGFCATAGVDLNGYQFMWDQPTSKFIVWTGAGTSRSPSSTWVPTTNTWYHIAMVRNGGTVTIYVNGSTQGTVADGDFNNDSQPFNVASVNTSNQDGSFNGWIDEFRLSNTARWTGSYFDVPTSEYNGVVAAIRQSCDGLAFNVG